LFSSSIAHPDRPCIIHTTKTKAMQEMFDHGQVGLVAFIGYGDIVET
jgi:hypothetical protein